MRERTEGNGTRRPAPSRADGRPEWRERSTLEVLGEGRLAALDGGALLRYLERRARR